MNEERFYILISRKLAGEATILELEELSEMLRQNEDFRNFVQKIEGSSFDAQKSNMEDALDSFDSITWQLTEITEYSPAHSFDLPKTMVTKNSSKSNKYWRYSILIMADVFILFCLAINPFQFNQKASKVSNTEIITSKGQKSALTLSDGTKVWLNTDSKLIYANDFSGKSREVTLIGEAFFDVSHDKTKPFIIHTRDMHIKVLGTAFNVKAYPKDKSSEASLIRGSIQVSFTNRPNEQLILKPNEKIKFVNTQFKTSIKKEEEPLITVEKLLVEASDGSVTETAWTQGRLIFKSKPFIEMISELERRYDINITVEKEGIESKLFTAAFENETIEEVLNLLKMSYHFDFKLYKKNKLVLIY